MGWIYSQSFGSPTRRIAPQLARSGGLPGGHKGRKLYRKLLFQFGPWSASKHSSAG